ncbi:hypothetical protein Ancab_031174 [Ancistrocladus abbreviatus]
MVTGASSGIGWEFCLDLAKAGCRIIAAARRTERLKSLCDQINQHSSSPSSADSATTIRAVAIELDVSRDDKAVQAAVQKAWDAFGRIDALINNAGIRGSVVSSLDLSEEEWDAVHKTNTRGMWLVSKHVCLLMRKAKLQGSVINISSVGGLNTTILPGAVAYNTSKAAVNSLTTGMALELGPFNIRVNSIAAGIFRTEITEKLMQKEWAGKVAQKILPLRDPGSIDPALTSLVRYLIHDSSKYVTGNIFIVDSGANLTGVPLYSSL